MPSLQCTVTNCASNCGSTQCCRPVIHVDGGNANCCEGTCCQSFSPTSGQATSQAPTESFNYPNANPSIKCNATNCTYNRNNLCSASNVDIAGCGASDCHGTTCRTFRAK